MDIESTTVTSEEIAQFRAELADYPNPEVIAALNAIEECEGYLEDAVPLLLLKAGREPDRSLSDILEKCRKFICQKEVRESLESGMIAPAIEPIAMGVGIPPGIATAVGSCAFKLGIKKVCADCAD